MYANKYVTYYLIVIYDINYKYFKRVKKEGVIINKNIKGIFNVGIYIRLSQEDKEKKYEAESESIINQKQVLQTYCSNNKLNLINEYIDDGYTGTNYDRPGFKRMIKDLEDKKINTVLVKDLSRLGRDHIMTGYYIENYFPLNNIRFISLQESFDSFKNQASNDSSTFIIACNDYYSKQNSVKIRSVLREKKKRGKFIGSSPSYGYLRDPEDKGHLIPDPETKEIVKKIFNWSLNGMTNCEIASKLNSSGIDSPSTRKNINKPKNRCSGLWTTISITKILSNQIYCGDMVQNKDTNISYKIKKRVPLDESMWIIVKDTHEPLVGRDTFNQIKLMKKRLIKKNYTNREKRLFENILYCAECGGTLTVTYKKNKDYWSVNCNKYSRSPKLRLCTPHFFPYDKLEKILLSNIKKTLKPFFEQIDVDQICEELKKEFSQSNEADSIITDIEKEMTETKERLVGLYDDYKEKIINLETYSNVQNSYTEKLNNLIKKRDSAIENKLNQDKVFDLYKKVTTLTDINNINRDLMLMLIDKIEIDDDKIIKIFYKHNFCAVDVINYSETTI